MVALQIMWFHRTRLGEFREQARLEYTEEEKAEYNRQIAEENVRQARIRANIEKRNTQIETHYAKVNNLLRN